MRRLIHIGRPNPLRVLASPGADALLVTLFSALVVVQTALVPSTQAAADPADTLYTGGTILTMDDSQPRVEAVAVRDGRIVAAGSLEDATALAGPDTRRVDLAGKALLPGFVDSHGHVVFGGLQAMSANLLAPPDGVVTDIPSLLDTLRAWMNSNPGVVERAGMVIGFGYDESQLAEQRPPTRTELDRVSADVPIILIHQSGHFGVANSRALANAGITAASKDPSGGVIRRDGDGEPTGVLEENAFFAALLPSLASLGEAGLEAFAEAGLKQWASFGYTTAQDGRSSAEIVGVLRKLGARGDLPIDVVSYPDVLVDRGVIADNVATTYTDRFRVGGAKLTIDGSPQGFTALRDRPYYDPVGDYPADYAGYASSTDDQINAAVDWAYANQIQILTHANGEGASDKLIAAIEAAQAKHGTPDIRPVLIHGQFLREDQLDAYQELGVFLSLFPMHTFYWGDWHRDHTVGPVAADNISPTGWARARGMMFGSHHDAPVAFPDSMRILSATVTRRTRSGDILGPAQRVDVMTALKAMTLWPAWQHFEEASKGSIAAGKLADFVVLSADPTAVDPETLADLEVMMTIKEDRVVYDSLDRNMAPLASAPYFADPEAAHRLLNVLYAASAGAVH